MNSIWSKFLRVVRLYEDDLKYLIIVGIPAGMLCILFSKYLDFTHLF